MKKVTGMSTVQNNSKYTSTLIPKNIVDAINLQKGEKLIFEVIDENTIIIKR